MRFRSMKLSGIAPLAAALFVFPFAAPAAMAQSVDKELAAQAIASSYPEFVKSADAEKIIWLDGSEMPLGQVRQPDQAAKILETPSVAEQFLFGYPLSDSKPELPKHDPGRTRNEPFFVKIYGDCRRTGLRGKLRTIRWLPKTAPQSVTVTTTNGIDRKLEAISAEIEKLPVEKRRAAVSLSGSYVCRVIAGTNRLSMHAYGAALDLHGRTGRYWRWSGLSEKARAVHFVPQEVIEIFERHGFIWGGNWYHVDSIHFEYRPELIAYARLLKAKSPPQ